MEPLRMHMVQDSKNEFPGQCMQMHINSEEHQLRIKTQPLAIEINSRDDDPDGDAVHDSEDAATWNYSKGVFATGFFTEQARAIASTINLLVEGMKSEEFGGTESDIAAMPVFEFTQYAGTNVKIRSGRYDDQNSIVIQITMDDESDENEAEMWLRPFEAKMVAASLHTAADLEDSMVVENGVNP